MPAISRKEWKEELGIKLLNNPLESLVPGRQTRADDVPNEDDHPQLGKILGYGKLKSVGTTALVCAVCSEHKVQGPDGKTRRSHHQCLCGAHVCNPISVHKCCWLTHMVECVDA